jgi:acylphosphatase
MGDLISVRARVYGRVHGVFFRAFAAQHARELGLTGYVRNVYDDRSVEVQAEGERKSLEKLIAHLKTGPPAAEVTRIETHWSDYTGQYHYFNIVG